MQLVNSTQNSARRRANPTALNWDLGLAVLEAHAAYGRCFTLNEIAEACGVSRTAVRLTIKKALLRVQPTVLAARKRGEF